MIEILPYRDKKQIEPLFIENKLNIMKIVLLLKQLIKIH